MDTYITLLSSNPPNDISVQSPLCLLFLESLLVRLGVNIVILWDFYFYQIIGKLTTFLHLQVFRSRNQTVDFSTTAFLFPSYYRFSETIKGELKKMSKDRTSGHTFGRLLGRYEETVNFHQKVFPWRAPWKSFFLQKSPSAPWILYFIPGRTCFYFIFGFLLWNDKTRAKIKPISDTGVLRSLRVMGECVI